MLKKEDKEHNLYQGKQGEMVVKAIVNSIWHKRDGYHCEFNDFDNYSSGIEEGVDFRVYEGDELFIDGEVKNWSPQKRTYGVDTVTEEIISRFEESKARIKLLIISFITLLSQTALELLESLNIHVFSFDQLMFTKDEFGDSFFKTKTFYSIKNRLSNFIKQLVKPKGQNFIFSGIHSVSLISYLATPITVNNNILNKTNITNKYDGVNSIINKIVNNNNKKENFALELVKTLLKYRLLKIY